MNPRPWSHAPRPLRRLPTAARLGLAALVMLLVASAGCRQEAPPPPVSVGDQGRKAVAPPTADAGQPPAAQAPAEAVDAGAQAAQTPAEATDAGAQAPQAPPADPAAAARLPTREDGRPDYLEDATIEQLQLLKAIKEALAAGNEEAATQGLLALQASEPLSGAKVTGIIALADQRRAEGQPDQAIALLEDLYRKVPPMQEVVFVLARAYKERGRIPEAILGFQEALRLQPLLLRAHIEVGGLYQQLGDADRASAAFLEYERAIYRYSKVLEDPKAHRDDKLKIAEALSFLPDDRAALALIEALDDPLPEVRMAAAGALAEVGTRAMIPRLNELAEASRADDPPLAEALAQAARRIEQMPEDEREERIGPSIAPPSPNAPPADAAPGNPNVAPPANAPATDTPPADAP